MRLSLIMLLAVFLVACSNEQGGATKPDAREVALSTCIKFVRALVDTRYADAHAFLGQELNYTPARLESEYLAWIAEIAPIKAINESGALFHDDWPDRRRKDYGWVYIWVAGDEDPEMVSVLVSDEIGAPKITKIEWGRPD